MAVYVSIIIVLETIYAGYKVTMSRQLQVNKEFL